VDDLSFFPASLDHVPPSNGKTSGREPTVDRAILERGNEYFTTITVVWKHHNNQFPYRSPLEPTMSSIWSEAETRREALEQACLRRTGSAEGTGQEHAECSTQRQGSYSSMLDVLPDCRVSVASPAIRSSVGADDPKYGQSIPNHQIS
jgi:hypothetical protein